MQEKKIRGQLEMVKEEDLDKIQTVEDIDRVDELEMPEANISRVDLHAAVSRYMSLHHLIDDFLARQPMHYDMSKIWWIWNKQEMKWEMSDETGILLAIDSVLQLSNSSHKSVRGELLDTLKKMARKKKPKEAPKTWVQFRDKIIDIKTSEEFSPSPDWFMTNPIPWRIGARDDTPHLDKLFYEWVGQDFVRTLYEVIAYCMLPDYPLHRIFVFLGAGSNGKTTFLKILKRFIGQANITSTEMETLLSSRFEMSKLYRKLACFMGETNFTQLKKTSVLKRLSGGDMIGYEFKNKMPFDAENTAKLVIATNNLPATTDKTDGFFRRWMIIDFPNKFGEKVDVMATIPDEEFENLALKCIPLLNNIILSREFYNEGTIEERSQKYEEKSDPLAKFVEDNVMEEWDGYIYKFEFKKRLDEFCKENNFRKLSETETGKRMKTLFGEGKRSMYFDNQDINKQIRTWEGVAWKEA